MFGSENMSKFTPLMPVSSLGPLGSNLGSNMGSSVTPVEMSPYKPVTAFGLVSSLAGPMPTQQQLQQHHSTGGGNSSNSVGGQPTLQRPVPKHSAGLTLKMPYSNQVNPLHPHSHHQQQQQQQHQHQFHTLQSDQHHQHHQHQQKQQQHNAHNNHTQQQQQSTLQLSSPDGSSSNQASPPDMSDNLSTTSSSSGDHSCNASGSSSGQFKRKGKGVPYIPSYMDLSNGPEPCVVCGDAATGYHYRCMTCEGCKGFFRRTIQKNLQYHCKWNKNCVIDKTTRNQCQECRFIKCLNVGMATDLVLNERQRTAKRKLIEDNRVRRKEEVQKVKPREATVDPDALTDQDRGLICEVVTAYEYTAGKIHNLNNKGEYDGVSTDLQSQDPESWQQLAEAMTPSIIKVVEFAKSVPGFTELNVDDQILLLKSCCMEIMCLRAACRFDPAAETLTLHNGIRLHKSQIHQGGLAVLIEPIFDFAIGLAKLQLDKAETALLASILLMQSDRSGLKDPESVERLQDAILGAFKRYVAENRPHQPVHWAKILMKVTDLRTISTRHAERVLCIRLDNSGEIPPLLLEVFNEGHSIS